MNTIEFIREFLKGHGFTCISHDENSKDTIYVDKDGTSITINIRK